MSSFLAALIPIFWLVSHAPIYLMLVQMFSGFSWSGVTLSAGNFIYDAVTPQKRVRCIAYFNVINGLALFFGSSLGGYFASRLPPLFGYRLLGLFALSCFCRLALCLLLSRSFREVRAAHEVSIQELFFQRRRHPPARGTSAGLTVDALSFYQLDNGSALASERCRIAPTAKCDCKTCPVFFC